MDIALNYFALCAFIAISTIVPVVVGRSIRKHQEQKEVKWKLGELENELEAFHQWMLAEAKFENLLRMYKVKISSATRAEGSDPGMFLLDYLSFGLSPKLKDRSKWTYMDFIGNPLPLSKMRKGVRQIDEIYEELEDLLMMWRSSHIFDLSNGNLEITLPPDWRHASAKDISSQIRSSLAERGLQDMIHCYYDGVPAADLAA